MKAARPCAALLLCGLMGACATAEPYDYTLFREHPPRSILVLPPLDNTLEVDAAYSYLSTVSRPLAEHGYYVFPVAVVDRMMRDNGMPTPGEMHTISLAKIAEIFGADAVLYITLKDWGTSYRVIDSATQVTAEARLVDVRSGSEIWSGSQEVERSSAAGGGGIEGMLLGAIANQIFSTISDPSQELARECNQGLFCSGDSGLLFGPYHEKHGTDG